MKKCGEHDRVLVARTMVWVDRYRQRRSMTVYECPVTGCDKMRSDKRAAIARQALVDIHLECADRIREIDHADEMTKADNRKSRR